MCFLTRIYSSKITVLDLIKIFSISKCKIYHWCISVDIYNIWFLFGLCVSYPLWLMNKLYELFNSFGICFMLIFVFGVWDRILYRSDSPLLSGLEPPPPCSTPTSPTLVYVVGGYWAWKQMPCVCYTALHNLTISPGWAVTHLDHSLMFNL